LTLKGALFFKLQQTQYAAPAEENEDTDGDTKMNFSSGATGLIARNPCYSKRKKVSFTKADG